MSLWADIFHPANKKLRTKLIQNFQKLEDELKSSFRASNKLAQYLSEKFEDVNIPDVNFDSSKSVKENAEALVAHMTVINAQLERLDEELKKKLPPDLYKRLTNVDTTFQQRIEISQKVGKVFASVAGVTTAVVVGTIVSTKLTSVISSTVGKIAVSSVVGAIVGSLSGSAVDVVFGAITGYLEKEKLRKAVEELEPMVNEFIEESQSYTYTIYEVLAEVKIWEQYHPNA